MAALTLGAIGVVFGDIGTSPLYAMKETFSGHHDLAPSEDAVYGVLSLIFWSITTIVSIKYVAFIMRADNDGEGGIMALISLVQSAGPRGPRTTWALIALGAFGAALFYGDGMITPAISVLSAVEGLEVLEPDLHDFVVPITLAILAVLFTAQRFGTAVVGRLFGPVMLVWFGALADPAAFHDNSRALNLKHPSVVNRVTQTLQAVHKMIDDLGFQSRPVLQALLTPYPRELADKVLREIGLNF